MLVFKVHPCSYATVLQSACLQVVQNQTCESSVCSIECCAPANKPAQQLCHTCDFCAYAVLIDNRSNWPTQKPAPLHVATARGTSLSGMVIRRTFSASSSAVALATHIYNITFCFSASCEPCTRLLHSKGGVSHYEPAHDGSIQGVMKRASP